MAPPVELRADLKAAFAAADRDGTAALNLVLVGGAMVIVSAVTLTATSGLAAILAAAVVWVLTLGAIGLWLAPHMAEIRAAAAESERHRQHDQLEERRRAIALLLEETTGSPSQRRRAADLLIEDD